MIVQILQTECINRRIFGFIYTSFSQQQQQSIWWFCWWKIFYVNKYYRQRGNKTMQKQQQLLQKNWQCLCAAMWFLVGVNRKPRSLQGKTMLLPPLLLLLHQNDDFVVSYARCAQTLSTCVMAWKRWKNAKKLLFFLYK